MLTQGGAGSYADTSCSPNTRYTYRLTASNQAGDSPAAASPEALTYPDVPQNLQKTGATSTTLTFSWTETNAANAPITYHIQRREQYYQGYWTAYHALTTTSSATLTDTGLNPNSTCAYEVMATNATGSSAYSAEMQFITGPAAPQYLTAYVMSSTAIQLYWSPVTGAVSYTLMRQTGSAAAVDAGEFAGTTTNTTDSGLTPFTTYTYTVVAHNANGNSDPSPPCNATTKPAPPSDVTATAISSSEIDLSWNDTSGGRASFIILRGYGTNFTQVGTTVVGVNTYQDTNLTPNVTYSYEIEAVNGSGNSDPSTPPASATTWPGAPTGLTATAVSSTEIDLTWDAANSEYGAALTYTVQRRNSDGTWTTRGTPGTNSFQDTGLTPNTQYTYQVIANNGGNSPASAPASATTYPDRPANLKAVPGDGRVTLTWDADPGAGSYNVKWSTTSGGPYAAVQNGSGVTATTLTDTSVSDGTTYYYVVTALPPAGNGYPVESPNSNEASATPSAPKISIQVRRTGTTTFGSRAIVAAGHADDPDHKADVLVTVTAADGTPVSGFQVQQPVVGGGDPAPDDPAGQAATLVFPGGTTTDASGTITGLYWSSNVVHKQTDDDDLQNKIVTIQPAAGQATLGSTGATIEQAWVDTIDPDRWNSSDPFFDENGQSSVVYTPQFKDGDLHPLQHHTELFKVTRVDVWHTDPSTGAATLIVYSNDPNIRQDGELDDSTQVQTLPDASVFAVFSPVTVSDSGGGSYASTLTLQPLDSSDEIDTVYFDAEDQTTWAE